VQILHVLPCLKQQRVYSAPQRVLITTMSFYPKQVFIMSMTSQSCNAL
jgi:hypothetical protein